MARNQSTEQALHKGKVVGGYRVIRLLGRGGMGEVYLAQDLTLRRAAALKILRPDVAGAHGVERFIKEARLASRITHSNVVTIYSAGAEEGLHYIAMQYIEGQNLAELTKHGMLWLPWPTALKLMRMASKGLHAVHAEGMIHRDIKPSNIMLSKDSGVFLMDFGLVRDEHWSDLTSTGNVIGTPCFMSPEQCRGERLDRRSDLFSIGATLYCLLTRRLPYDGSILEVLQKVGRGTLPPPVHEACPQIPREVSDLVKKAMSVRREDRFSDARTLNRELGKLLKSERLSYLHSANRGEAAVDTPADSIRAAKPTTVITAAVVPELAPLELLPSDRAPTTSPWLRHLPWIICGLAVLGAAVVGSFFMRAPPPEPSKDMVWIDAGYVCQGDEERQLRNFWHQYITNEKRINALVDLSQEEPRMRKWIKGFWIDKYEVTNAQYARFVAATGHRSPSHWGGSSPSPAIADHAVVNVSYADAEAYAQWAGKKLPTRQQWLRAFRGDHQWLLPWGNTYDATWALVHDHPDDPDEARAVSSSPRDVSSFGVYNLVGNVGEFVRGTFQFRGQPYRMVKGADHASFGYVFGVASMHFKYGIGYKDGTVGFRCVIEQP